jgi:hypothetical protein
MLTSPLLRPFRGLEFSSVAFIGILWTQLFGAPFVERLVPAPTLLREDLNGLADCVFLFSHLNQAERASSLKFKYS